ncbi:squalene synthase HpnC [Sphingomonas tabacisoli]|uniref:Squalene synthase HpnC n=1 Tax=Sphingomonas tabacisoli TaxID=2249466 RepID=A0ABW4I4R9_9SPHN
MEVAADLASGKGHRDENFPVASWLLKREHRAPILTFYRFARAADDIADHPTASPEEKLHLLGAMRRGLDGASGGAAEALALREALEEPGIPLIHAQELLDAFEQDVTVTRYPDWSALMAYCRKSAMPVGRFVLDVHGEDRATWPLSDALCAALQIINHLQDCAKDYRELDRVYLPLETLVAEGAAIEELAAPAASPGLRRAITGLARQTLDLLAESRPFARHIRSRRLALEVAVIQRLAEDLAQRLTRCDPLSEPVHHGKLGAGWVALRAMLAHTIR